MDDNWYSILQTCHRPPWLNPLTCYSGHSWDLLFTKSCILAWISEKWLEMDGCFSFLSRSFTIYCALLNVYALKWGEIFMPWFVAIWVLFCWVWHVLHLSALSLMHESLCSIWWLSRKRFWPSFFHLKLKFQFGALHYVLENILSIWQKLPCYYNSRGPSPSLRSNPVTPFSVFRRLAKSTLLLIPLFGINYVVFVYIIDENGEMENYKIFFDLGLGSFQVRNMPKCVTSDYIYLLKHTLPFHSLEIFPMH